MRYFLSKAASPLKYLSCGNLYSKQDFLHHRRSFDINVFILVKEGILYIAKNGINYEVGPNQYILLNADEEHFGYKPSSGKLSYSWVHFRYSDEAWETINDNFLYEISEHSMEDSQNRIYFIPEYGKISFTQRASLLFNHLLDLSRQEIIYSNQLLDYALSLLIMEVSQEFLDIYHKKKYNIPPHIARVIEWIKTNCYNPITVSEIAEEFGYNQDYLSSLFKKTTGKTLINYINQSRIDISKSLIANYDIQIKEVAYSCGFTDEKYFMKVFKKFEGITPTQYKKTFNK